MSGVNKVIIIGNLGRDPEMRATHSGNSVCNLSIATTRRWRDKQTNEMMEDTEWHRVTVFGKSGEACGNHLAKGSSAYVEGYLKTRSYEDKDGVKKYSTEIIADRVQFLGGRNDSGGGQGGQRGGSYGGGNQGGGQGGSGGPAPYDPGNYSPTGKDDDDIPF